MIPANPGLVAKFQVADSSDEYIYLRIEAWDDGGQAMVLDEEKLVPVSSLRGFELYGIFEESADQLKPSYELKQKLLRRR